MTKVMASTCSPCSPAGSDISVGAPSPPPPKRKANPGRVKSFSIEDILGNGHKPEPRPAISIPIPVPMRAYIPAALVHHYEQALAFDYQQKLQEHFKAQALMLSQMSMRILPADICSERSSSAESVGFSSEKSENKKEVKEQKTSPGGTPLDALFKLTTKDFTDPNDNSHIDLFSNRPTPKKKRKSRTAFTNHQIFELEKRFLYQKYLTPADRDEIASGLGISNAQIITWFQNRRAKLKRDMEELRKDVESVHNSSAGGESFLDNDNDLRILKKKSIGCDDGEQQDGRADQM